MGSGARRGPLHRCAHPTAGSIRGGDRSEAPHSTPDLVEACLAVVEPQANLLQGSGGYGTSVDVPAGADAQTRLLGLLGRQTRTADSKRAIRRAHFALMPFDSAVPSGSRFVSPLLIGRSPQLALLRSAIERVRDGQGCTLLVTGDAGIGKSRLIATLRAEALETGFRISKQAARTGRKYSVRAIDRAARSAVG